MLLSLLPARLVTGLIRWLPSYLSSVDALLAVDSLSFTNVNMLTDSTNKYQTATLKQTLACEETVLFIGTEQLHTSQHKEFQQTVVPSASGIFVILYCNAFMPHY